MKSIKFACFIALGLIVAVAASGCRKRPGYLTEIPGARTPLPKDIPNEHPITLPPATTAKDIKDTRDNKDTKEAKDTRDIRDRDVKDRNTQDKPLNRVEETPKVIITEQPQVPPDQYTNYTKDATILKSCTVRFDFDSSAIRASERPKVVQVADYLNANPKHALEVDGHCDERGTEEYNRSLGERRALAIREELLRMGIDPMRIETVSFGKDRPVDANHNEAAWRENRRGEFIVEVPPPPPAAK